MDWISRHASEILVAAITALVTTLILKGFDYLFAKRTNVAAFLTSAAQFNLPGAPGQPGTTAYTITLALQNLGRAVAEDIRIVHSYLPAHYQAWPPMNAPINQLQSGHWELVIPRILSKQMVFVSYLDAVPLTSAIFVQIEMRDRLIPFIPIQFTRLLSPWAIRGLTILLLLGAGVAVRYLYLWGTAFVRFLASLMSR